MTPKPARTLLLALFALALAALLSPAGAAAAKKHKKRSSVPTVSSVAPMKLAIGDTLTIRGRNFRAGRNKNTVVFKRDGQRAIFVKAREGTSTRLRLVVPAKLAQYLSHNSKSGAARPTRFRLRVLSKRFGRAFTATKLSPVIAAATPDTASPSTGVTIRSGAGAKVTAPVVTDPDCDNDGVPNSRDADDDNDLLSDALEVSLKLNTCNYDTDGDGMGDGWEYQSAIDLNNPGCNAPNYPTPCTPALPYPGKVTYPNPLDGSDGGEDYDGDWISSYDEYTAWAQHPGHSLSMTGMWYSAGLKSSQDSDPSDGCTGMSVPTPRPPFTSAYSLLFDRSGNGCLNDGERDEDNDMLSNVAEQSGALSGVPFWTGNFTTENPFGRVTYKGTNWLDADTDGDGVYDGMDDQDFDDFWNAEEQVRGTMKLRGDGSSTGQLTGLWVNPFNPCLPNPGSRTCPDTAQLGMAPWAPLPLEDGSFPNPRWPLWDEGSWPGTDAPTHPLALPS
jgi:hypothetical protein